MTKLRTESEIREEWKDDGIYGCNISTYHNGEVDYDDSADSIADWWLSLRKEDMRVMREIITLEVIYACAEYTNMHQDTSSENIAVNTVRAKILTRLSTLSSLEREGK